MEKVSLKPDLQLMHNEFEGYKLTLDSVPVHHSNLEADLEIRAPSEDQFSYLHVKLFGTTNLLVIDKFNPGSNHAYLLDAKHESIFQISDRSTDGRPPEIIKAWTSPQAVRPLCDGDYNPSLQFADSDLAVFADGRGFLFLLETGRRTDEFHGEWKTLFHAEVSGSNRPFVVASAAKSSNDNGDRTVQCLLQYVEDLSKVEMSTKNVDKSNHQMCNVVEWISLVESKENLVSSWRVDRVRRFLFYGGLDYLDLGPQGSSLMCVTDKNFLLVHDSEGLPEEEEPEPTKKAKMDERSPPAFYWMQGVEDMVIWLMLPEGTTKKDLEIALKPSQMEVKVKGESKVSGKLWNVLDGDSMTWTIQKGGKLEITACKANEGLIWKRFLQDESVPDGEEVMDPAMVDKLHQEMSAFTTVDLPMDDGQGRTNIYNAQELEDVDEMCNEDSRFYVYNGANGYTVNLSGRQWLFNIPSTEEGHPQRLCLRHDVDGLVWQPDTDDGFEMKHIATFCALGYVQASKQQRKFSFSAPDLSFSAICDRTRHIYIYRQPEPLADECELRNRKSGKEVRLVAKQSVVTLEDNSEIFGAVSSNRTVFIATQNAVYAVHVKL